MHVVTLAPFDEYDVFKYKNAAKMWAAVVITKQVNVLDVVIIFLYV